MQAGAWHGGMATGGTTRSMIVQVPLVRRFSLNWESPEKDACTFHVRSDGATLAEIAPGAEWNVGESAAKFREGASSFWVQIEAVSMDIQEQEWISKSFGKGKSGKENKGKGKGTGKGKPKGKGKDNGKGKGFPKGKGAEWNVGESAAKHREGAYSSQEQIGAVSMDIQEQEVDFLLVGSSVAAAAKGWSGLLRKALQTRGKSLANACTPGNNTARTMPDLQHALTRFKPKVVIIALSTGNEGLAWRSTSSSAAALAEQFQLGVQDLTDVAEAAGAKVVLGSVYPNNNYARHHYSVLKQVFTQQCSSGLLVLDFLTCTDDGNGHWRDGLWKDAGHPNRAGHAAMFRAIDLEKLIAVAE
eukprot:TRINITY_DN7811_c0_g1_i1.p1 TRINITY_DN7811_c0_g1~~TRINITY_DN7811_c0_g1_i1.p1  ORF type:complete len:358 (-),score=86.02 TRINITY_DN7811_c0_g1_i1:228-1301(-)